ncbi:MAG: hypothetical protein HFJ42_07315 [Clostridia bacterium]|nr:hypothetical protein [Clostridia bacterium]
MTGKEPQDGSPYETNTTNTGGGKGHTHTLNNHTHTLNNHTHTNPNTNSASSMPPYIAVWVWKRVA